ncbi:MAG: DNA replication protein DnaC, partial [Oscillospiraceae bacterium]|nr:DNA replication protein DnaC [Oscillospiraceae bacterium]
KFGGGRAEGAGGTAGFFDAALLVIDDLGTEMVTAFVQSALYDVINTRLLNGSKTIINANLTSERLTERYLPQTCSRLLGEYKMLHFFGPDLRMARRKSGFKI